VSIKQHALIAVNFALHNISTLPAGMVAQEVIKIITKQYRG
jgi:hypothetical protein